MAPAFSKVAQALGNPSIRNTTLVVASGVLAYYISRLKVKKTANTVRRDSVVKSNAKKSSGKPKRSAMKQFLYLLRILVPKLFSIETGYLIMVAISMVARTYFDLWMISNNTSIENSIISRSSEKFQTHIFKLVQMMPILSIVNNSLKFGLEELRIRFRTNLTKYLYDKYLASMVYYKMTNLDNRISNPDQVLTQDVEKFCHAIIDLYSNLAKPILDIMMYTVKTKQNLGLYAPVAILGYMVISGGFLMRLRKPVSGMTIREQELEGEFRHVNSRLLTNSEEVAFYSGNLREKSTITEVFRKLIDHCRDFVQFRLSIGFIDNIVAKYIATCVGFYVVSRPFLNLNHPRHMTTSHSERLQDYYENGRMIYKMAESVGRVSLAGRELSRFSGYTQRVSQLDEILDDLKVGKFKRTLVNTDSKSTTNDSSSPGASPDAKTLADFIDKRGRILFQNHLIKFDEVPIVTPNGDVLIESMSFEVKSGMNVLVSGPNGCGKSSLFRILGGLWPLYGGVLTKPAHNPHGDQSKSSSSGLFYIPQRPYMTIGTLRDQIIYPDTTVRMSKRGLADHNLDELLAKVQLSYIVEREGGWDSVRDWMDVLSGGEKQRVAMARVFYHRPQFAILDECTSAVSVDVEGAMYTECKTLGITLFTVSHRRSLWKYHEYSLHIDGRGSYEYTKIDKNSEIYGT